jgi:hypothetical protein
VNPRRLRGIGTATSTPAPAGSMFATPKLRQGSYFPEWLLEHRRRAEAANATEAQRRRRQPPLVAGPGALLPPLDRHHRFGGHTGVSTIFVAFPPAAARLRRIRSINAIVGVAAIPWTRIDPRMTAVTIAHSRSPSGKSPYCRPYAM